MATTLLTTCPIYTPFNQPFYAHHSSGLRARERERELNKKEKKDYLSLNLFVLSVCGNLIGKMTAGSFAHLTLAFGLLGNVVSFMVFLSPLPTFYKIYKKKSAEGYQSVPYVVALFSAMLWIYYALLKSNAMLLITINSVGCFIQTFYLCFFIFYAPKKARIESLKLIGLMIVVGFGLIVGLTQFLASGANRVAIVGWICLVFALCVFVAPMGVVRQVIKTKSVEYMPILLSVALTLNAVTWFFYGMLLHDYNIAIPNVLGFTFGILQIILYFVYKNKKPVCDDKLSGIEIKTKAGIEVNTKADEQKIPENKDQEIVDIVKLSAALMCSINPVVAKLDENNNVFDDRLVVEPHVTTIEVAA